MSPLTSRNPFITQLGLNRNFPFGPLVDNDLCQDIVVDPVYEDIYCSGFTTGSVVKKNNGAKDVLLLKFNRHGKLLWARQFDSLNSRDETCANIGMDDNGFIYCGGHSNGLMVADTGNRSDTNAPRADAASDFDAMVMKFNRKGEVIWIKQFGSSKDENCSNMSVSGTGNIYCSGSTNGIFGTDFSNGPEYRDNDTNSNNDSYIAKLNKDGVLLWNRQIGSSGFPGDSDYDDKCAAVTIDRDENAYCAGATYGSLGELNGSGSNGGSRDMFVWSVTKDGDYRFLKQIGTPSITSPHIYDTSAEDLAYEVAIDKDGNIYLGGITTGAVARSTAPSDTNALLIKFDKSLNILWAFQSNNVGSEILNSIETDDSGNIYLAGLADSEVFGAHKGDADLFVIKMSGNKELLYQKQIGTSKEDSCAKITLDSHRNVYCAGFTSGNLGEPNAKSDATTWDAFILRLSPTGKL